jgi:aminopeptidase N
MTMQALRAKIGDQAFFTLLRRWCDIYRGSTASTSDFVSLAEQVSNRNLDPFFQTWLYKPTKPAATEVVATAAGMPATAKGNKHRPGHG